MRARPSLVAIAGAVGALVTLGACQAESPGCIQSLGIDITNVVVDAYNDAVRGSPNGSGSWNYTCNKGGSVAISGSVNTSTVTFDLQFVFNMCAHDDLVLSGTIQDTTANGFDSDTKTEHATSDALTMFGTAIGCDANPIDATCEVDIFYDGTWTTEICGLSYP